MTCCLWPVWLPPMTIYSFNIYVYVPVWFKFEHIRILKANGCKVYNMLLGFLWLPSMTHMIVWFLWVKKIWSSNSRGNFVPLHICFYDCTSAHICFYAMFQNRYIYDYNYRYLWWLDSNFNFFQKNIHNKSHMVQKMLII